MKTKKLGISKESSEGRLVREGHKGAEHEGSRFNVYAMYVYEFPRLFSSLFAGGVCLKTHSQLCKQGYYGI